MFKNTKKNINKEYVIIKKEQKYMICFSDKPKEEDYNYVPIFVTKDELIKYVKDNGTGKILKVLKNNNVEIEQETIIKEENN